MNRDTDVQGDGDNRCSEKRCNRVRPTAVNSFEKKLPMVVVHLMMLVCAILVSTSFTVGAAITAALDPALLTLVRFCFAALLFAPIVYYRYGFCFSWSLLWRCGVISGCLVVFFCCMFLSLRYTSALNTSVIFALVPSISCIYSLVIIGERLGREQMIALGCGLFGVVWVIFRGDLSLLLTMQWNKGDLIFLTGCLFMGLYTPLIKLLHRGESMAVMTFWVLVSGSAWLLMYGGYRLLTTDLLQVPMFAWGGILYLAIFTTIVTFFLTQYSVPYLGATRVMAYSYLYPGLVLVIDLLLGHGLPPLRVLPGVVVVLVAMVVLMSAKDDRG
ncbi:DMT family transporter [Desulforhopalus singaporensis]|uniref:Permease of the drug/metabolite transporter (DMT) superfamily n=1 Tax=Desulforhopalus singaporensis TaxID=91360 RepID=A0A1H0L3H7_9BACT|nr:DMT family transporter [Desulforhopalus singaporensis]SDO62768.1 Permease of the drug/metabolite transporter (DMT) superfamily [Desulforhopalus singaporensis]